ncbi:MAG: hypothetical protein EXR46_06015 [Dehalococcoidia bacterium]|nr:hypothetical protein [Dehalococcoidia bacterium]
MTFLNPVNLPVDWTKDEQVFVVDASGQRVQTETFYADGSGRSTWVRWNALDAEGQWTVQVAVNESGKRYDGHYALTPLQLPAVSFAGLGVAMRRYSGASSEVYLSSGTPASVARDLSGRLPALTYRLESWLLLTSAQIPNVYLFASSSHFRQAITAVGATDVSPFASGIYLPTGNFRGVYVTLGEFTSETVKILVHEQTHLLVDEAAPTADIPAWLNEGMATYLEINLSPEFGAGVAAVQDRFHREDMVKASLDAGTLIPLSSLVSQKDWNGQAYQGLVTRQYSQAYMAVRYLTEGFGDQSVGLILKELERKRSFTAAFSTVTGITLTQFERDWKNWLEQREDPAREQLRQYVAEVDYMLEDAESISDDRQTFLASAAASGPFAQRAPAQTHLVNRAAALTSWGNTLAYPVLYGEMHQELLAFLAVFQGWLQTELDASTKGDNTLVRQANAMIPEVSARKFSVRRQANSIMLVYQLQE